MAKTQENATRCTEKEIGIMDECEALRMDLEAVEEAMHQRGIPVAERNALDFHMQVLVEEIAQARAESFS